MTHVYYVEDAADNVRVMQRVLRSRPDLKLTIFSHPDQILRQGPPEPSVLFADMYFEMGTDGARLVETLREVWGWQCPIIVISAYPYDQMPHTYITHFLQKPIQVEELIDILSSLHSGY